MSEEKDRVLEDLIKDESINALPDEALGTGERRDDSGTDPGEGEADRNGRFELAISADQRIAPFR